MRAKGVGVRGVFEGVSVERFGAVRVCEGVWIDGELAISAVVEYHEHTGHLCECYCDRATDNDERSRTSEADITPTVRCAAMNA